jgi:hypothetical protein
MPELARRRWDRDLTRIRSDALPASPRGAAIPGRRAHERAELPVLVDRWSGPPIEGLQKRINDAFEGAGAYMTSVTLPFAESLSAWSRLLDVHFLFIFDRFEEFLAAHAHTEEGRQFTQEIARVVRTPELAVNLLFCVSGVFESDMQRYQSELLDLDDSHRVREDPAWGDLPRPRATRAFAAACAATITAIGVFCWPMVPSDVRMDAREHLASSAQMVERNVSDLVHRLQRSLNRVYGGLVLKG